MKTEEVLKFIETASDEDLEVINHAIKNIAKPKRINKSAIIKDDILNLTQVLPKTTTEYKGRKYNMTCASYIRSLRDLTDVVLHSYAVHYSTRGYPVWSAHESVAEAGADDYRAVFHELSETLLNLMSQYGTSYK